MKSHETMSNARGDRAAKLSAHRPSTCRLASAEQPGVKGAAGDSGLGGGVSGPLLTVMAALCISTEPRDWPSHSFPSVKSAGGSPQHTDYSPVRGHSGTPRPSAAAW